MLALRLRAITSVRYARFARRAVRSHRARSARRALTCGIAAVVLATFALSTAGETVRPEWRDPEYGHRLQQIQRWQQERPDRPLAVLIGSSHVQMALSPKDVGIADEAGSPLVYNCGYRAGGPMWACLQVSRLLDAGVKPRAVLFGFGYYELLHPQPAEVFFAKWGSRLSERDLRWLEPYSHDPTILRKKQRAARLNPWSQRHEDLLCQALPDSFSHDVKAAYFTVNTWNAMDEYGFAAWPWDVTEADRRTRMNNHQTGAFRGLSGTLPIAPFSNAAIRNVIARCQAEGVAVAGFRLPEAPTYQSWYKPAGRDAFARFTKEIAADYRIPYFTAPNHLTDADFADCTHLTREGAAAYSKWFANEHLKPWMASLPADQLAAMLVRRPRNGRMAASSPDSAIPGADMTENSKPNEAWATALGRIPSGLFILTARHGDRETGMLASWVQQCSFDPPRVSVAVRKDRGVLDWLTEGAAFVLNVVPADGKALIAHFGKGFELDEPAFQGLELLRDDETPPVLLAAHAYLECRVATRCDAGDHVLVIGNVAEGETLNPAEPMIHVRKNGLRY